MTDDLFGFDAPSTRKPLRRAQQERPGLIRPGRAERVPAALPASSGRVPFNKGICRGGPFDGRPLYHHGPSCRETFRDGRPVTYFGPAAEGLKFGWYLFEGGEWIWHPELDLEKLELSSER